MHFIWQPACTLTQQQQWYVAVADHIGGGTPNQKFANSEVSIGTHDDNVNVVLGTVATEYLLDFAGTDFGGYFKAGGFKGLPGPGQLFVCIARIRTNHQYMAGQSAEQGLVAIISTPLRVVGLPASFDGFAAE